MTLDLVPIVMVGAVDDIHRLTRTIFGNIPDWSKLLFYLLAAAAVIVFGIGSVRRARIWRRGRPNGERIRATGLIGQFVQGVLLQHGVWGRGWVSVAHGLLFSGFVVLLIGTTLIAVEHILAAVLGRDPLNPVFHKGVYYAAYEVTTDAFGLALLVGIVMLAVRRWRRPDSLDHSTMDWIVLVLLFTIGATGYLVEGLRIICEQTFMPGFSFLGFALARLWHLLGVDRDSASVLHLAFWWFHAILALGFIAVIPYTRLLHVIAGAINLSLPEERLGDDATGFHGRSRGDRPRRCRRCGTLFPSSIPHAGCVRRVRTL